MFASRIRGHDVSPIAGSARRLNYRARGTCGSAPRFDSRAPCGDRVVRWRARRGRAAANPARYARSCTGGLAAPCGQPRARARASRCYRRRRSAPELDTVSTADGLALLGAIRDALATDEGARLAREIRALEGRAPSPPRGSVRLRASAGR